MATRSSGAMARLGDACSKPGDRDSWIGEHPLRRLTYTQLRRNLPPLGTETAFVDASTTRRTSAEPLRLEPAPSMAKLSVIPRLDVLDIAAVAAIAHEHNLPLSVDNTFASRQLSADRSNMGPTIVLDSATKFIGGHGTSIGGVIVDSDNFPWDHGLFPGCCSNRASLPRIRSFYGNVRAISF